MQRRYIFLILIMLTPIFMNISTVEGKIKNEIIYIDVAVESSGIIVPWQGYKKFYEALKVPVPDSLSENNYSWVVGDKEYRFRPEYIDFEDIMDGKLDDYDVYAYIGPHDIDILCGTPWLCVLFDSYRGNKSFFEEEIKEILRDFIKGKHGYIGHCAGAHFPLDLMENEQPTTLKEKEITNNAFLEDFIVRIHRGTAGNPIAGWPIVAQYFTCKELWKDKWILFPLSKPDPARQAACGYNWWSSFDPNNLSSAFGGPNIDLDISTPKHAIFDGYLKDTWCVHTVGGSPFYVPPDNNNMVLATFPSKCFDSNESTQISRWSFPKAGLSLILNLWSWIRDYGFIWFDDIYDFYLNLTDWRDCTSKIIKLGYENLPAVVAFPYPDENGGRVLLTGFHPESDIWTGGHIQDKPDLGIFKGGNCMWDGLYAWYDKDGYLMTDPTIKYQANKWFIRRETAWASGVEDDHLPPIYGQSQVANSPVLHEDSEFTIECCVGLPYNDDYDVNLSLYYQYNESADGTNFTNWIYYDSIYDIPYQFTFNPSQANDTGIYRFCTLLNYSYETDDPPEITYYQEDFPPGPDSECYVGDDIIVANFDNPSVTYNTKNITFSDISSTCPDTHIVNHSWDFGDGNISYECNPTHKYANSGVYIVWHNVTNNVSNTSSISKIITVHNVPPQADFLPTSVVVKVGETVNFMENATDLDGSIVEYY